MAMCNTFPIRTLKENENIISQFHSHQKKKKKQNNKSACVALRAELREAWFINFMSSVKRESHFAIELAKVEEITIHKKKNLLVYIGKTIKRNSRALNIVHQSECSSGWWNLNRNGEKHAIKQIKADATGFYLCCIAIRRWFIAFCLI